MQRRVLFLLAWFSLFPIVVKAQENPRQLNVAGSSSPGSSNSTAVSLLQQSHDLNPQFNLGTRINLLGRQAENGVAPGCRIRAILGSGTASSRGADKRPPTLLCGKLGHDHSGAAESWPSLVISSQLE